MSLLNLEAKYQAQGTNFDLFFLAYSVSLAAWRFRFGMKNEKWKLTDGK